MSSAPFHGSRPTPSVLTIILLSLFTYDRLLLDLNLCEHFDFSEEEFAACGPGSRNCLVDIFGKYVSGFELEAMRWIQANQDHYWAKYGITDVPHLCPARKPGLNVVDIEHTLCEVFKYRRARDRLFASSRAAGRPAKRAKRGRPSTSAVANGSSRADSVAPASPATSRTIKKEEDQDGVDGLDFDRIRSNGSKTSSSTTDKVKTFAPTGESVTGSLPAKWLIPRPPDNYERPEPIDRSDEVYEVSHIVAITPTQSKCLVRWKGFGPEDDTWEYFDELVNGGAKEAVEEYLKWIKKVKDTIEEMLDEEKREKLELQKMSAKSLISGSVEGGEGDAEGEGGRKTKSGKTVQVPQLPFASNLPLALPF